jgi:hypothetical protein
MEVVVIEMEKFKWDAIRYDYQLVNDIDFRLKEVKIKDDYFANDPTYNELKKASIRSYKALQKYAFEKRNNIK